MRPQRLITRIGVVLSGGLLLCAAPFTTGHLPAVHADDEDAPTCPEGTVPSPGNGYICIPAQDPGTPPGNGDTGDGGSGGSDTTGCPDAPGGACTDGSGGVWNSEHQCYAYRQDPQPGPNDPVWEANNITPEDGSFYECSTGPNTGAVWFVRNGEDTPPDPGQMAQTIVKTMPLVKPTVHMAPQPPLMTYVGLPTWLWMNQTEWTNVTGTATIGDTTVTVVAKPVRVTWDLTAGTETCTSAGRPWVKGMGSGATTDCSYTFQKVSDFQPNGEFPVTAQITYQVDWTCSGTCTAASGTLGEVAGFTSEPTAIRVGERQSVVIP